MSQLNIKLITIGILTLVMLLPLSLIERKVSERQHFRDEAGRRIAESWTGPQSIMTPVLVIPYHKESLTKVADTSSSRFESRLVSGQRLVMPNRAAVTGKLDTEVRYSGLYGIPVYQTELQVSAEFSPSSIATAYRDIAAEGGEVEGGAIEGVAKPFLAVYLTDARGLGKPPTLQVGADQLEFQPGSRIHSAANGMHAVLPDLNTDGQQKLSLSFTVALRGSQSLSIIPAATQAEVDLTSNWPHPRFIGNQLPLGHQATETGFEAGWEINHLASQIGRRLKLCENGDCGSLHNASVGVGLINPVDIYLKTERATKYGILFIGLSFLFIFLAEHMTAARAHAIQYGLVGLANAVFFLLLLALSEHLDFALAYIIATTASISVIHLYVSQVFTTRGQGRGFTGALALLYALLYVILSAEDTALLMGSVLVYTVLAVVMLLTRRVDWYRLTAGDPSPREEN